MSVPNFLRGLYMKHDHPILTSYTAVVVTVILAGLIAGWWG